jgi:hypothetical protein
MGRLAGNEVAETGPIYTEELRDPLKGPLDLGVPLAQRNVNQAGGDFRQQALETYPFGQRQLCALPARPLPQEARDEKGPGDGQHASSDDPPLGACPQRRFLVPHDVSGRESILTETAASVLPSVEHATSCLSSRMGRLFDVSP